MNRFITFEGIDGSGKTTQIKLLKKKLEAEDYSVLQTRQPGGTELSKDIRHILLNKKQIPEPLTELFLFMADRSQHVQKTIKPALNNNKIVLCDRYTDSTLAYQGFGRDIDISTLNTLNKIATDGLMPGLTILIDIPPTISSGRLDKSINDRFDSETSNFMNKTRNGYIEISKQDPKRIKMIDGSKTIDEIHQEIASLVSDFLKSN